MLKAESAGRKLTGRDAQIQAEWTKWRDESSAEAKKVSAAQAALSDARPDRGAEPHGQLRLANADGRRAGRHARVEGHLRDGDGARRRRRHSQKNYVMTAQRAVVKTDNGERQGKWIITAIKPA